MKQLQEKQLLHQYLPNIIHDTSVLFASTDVNQADTKRILKHQHPKHFVFSFDKRVILSLDKAFKVLQNTQQSLTISLMKYFNKILAFDALEPGEFAQQSMKISGIKYQPPVPSLNEAQNLLKTASDRHFNTIQRSIRLMLQLSRAQLFWDGNKRTSFLCANYYLYHYNDGLLWITPQYFKDYQKQLKHFYETGQIDTLAKLIQRNNWIY